MHGRPNLIFQFPISKILTNLTLLFDLAPNVFAVENTSETTLTWEVMCFSLHFHNCYCCMSAVSQKVRLAVSDNSWNRKLNPIIFIFFAILLLPRSFYYQHSYLDATVCILLVLFLLRVMWYFCLLCPYTSVYPCRTFMHRCTPEYVSNIVVCHLCRLAADGTRTGCESVAWLCSSSWARYSGRRRLPWARR